MEAREETRKLSPREVSSARVERTVPRRRRSRKTLLNVRRLLTLNSKATSLKVGTPNSKKSAWTTTLMPTSRRPPSPWLKRLKPKKLRSLRKQPKNEQTLVGIYTPVGQNNLNAS